MLRGFVIPVFLSRVFETETVTIGTMDGTETIAQAKDVFTGCIDFDFIKWGLSKPGKATQATNAIIYETVNDGSFAELFGGISGDLNRLCWQESQVVNFCREHPDKLRKDGYGTFFLITKDGEPAKEDKSNVFVANVRVYDVSRLKVHVRKFSYVGFWGAEYCLCIVVPQQ